MDLYSCLLLPLVRDPNDPYLLVALGTTIFSGNLIAQTALRKSQPIVVIEDPSRSNFLPILLDDPGRESGDIGDEVSILISSQGDAKGEVTFSGDTTSTRPTDISAVGQESASDGGGLELSRRTFDTTGEKQRSGSAGKPKRPFCPTLIHCTLRRSRSCRGQKFGEMKMCSSVG